MTPDALATLQHCLTTSLAGAPDEARRLVHGRGRRWPGLEQVTVDWLQGVLLVSLFRPLDPPELTALQTMLGHWGASQPRVQGLAVQHRYRPDCDLEWLMGAPLETLTIVEHGLRFRLDLGRKQNTGLFLDMRHGRQWVRAQAEGKRVLNLFAYTCGFSVAAVAGGAQHVLNLDMSSAALSRGRENHRLNGHDLTRVGFLDHDLFKSWGKVRRSGPYDLVIVDPPSFQKGSFATLADYPKILRRLPDLLMPGGTVLACLNDPGLSPDFLIEHMAREAPGLRFDHRLENPPEFADLQADGGLKVLLFAAPS